MSRVSLFEGVLDCCELVCGAPTTFQGYEIEKNRIINLVSGCQFTCLILRASTCRTF